MGMLTVIKNTPKAIMKSGHAAMFALKKTKPQIMVGAGAVMALGGFVWAIINAKKIDATVAENEADIQEIESRIQTVKDGNTTDENGNELPSLKDLEKSLRNAKIKGIIKMCKLMGIPCLIFAGGLMLCVGGHIILLRRFSELSTAFATLQQTFDRYRQMNIAEHGEECDRRYRYGIVGEEKVEATITDENGKEKKVTCKVPVVDKDSAASMYTFEFSEHTSPKCPKDPTNMISFLRSQEKYWNVWMETTGKPVTLYMVLNDLDIFIDPDDPRKDYIMIAGWRPNGDGDNKIDFGIMRAINKPAIDMLENVCILNFNCDGNLYHSVRYLKNGMKVQ